ncbi:hypothetical protein HV170_13660 [Citrobacter freundii]|uniref:hypothetical protein n=1 Tax=Citrobacter freundii TaxID=546 RepID=UPI0015F54802|nr:hypothetical protein [Citrobacter freundii]
MEEKRFTPGPWFVQDDEWTDGDTANITSDFRSDNSIVPVAQISGGGSESGYDGDFSLEQKANAKLIAAAPELLEALQCLFENYKALADSGDAGNWQLEDEPAGQKALHAIAKALGKEHS